METQTTDELLTATAAQLDRVGDFMAQLTGIRHEITDATDGATAMVTEATAAGKRDESTRTAILTELAGALDSRAPRAAKLITWLAQEVSELEANSLLVFDRLERPAPTPQVLELLDHFARMGDKAAELADQLPRNVESLDSISEHQVLQHAAGRRAADIEREIKATAPLAVMGARARRITKELHPD